MAAVSIIPGTGETKLLQGSWGFLKALQLDEGHGDHPPPHQVSSWPCTCCQQGNSRVRVIETLLERGCAVMERKTEDFKL